MGARCSPTYVGGGAPSSLGERGVEMSGIEAFRYDRKRALVVGGATGMGAAAARTVAALGGEVVVMDYAKVDFPVAQFIEVDLRDRSAIDAALGELQGPIHAL